MQLAISALISLKPIKIHNNQAAPPTPQPQPQAEAAVEAVASHGAMMMISDRADSFEWIRYVIISSKHERDAPQTPTARATPALIPDTPSATASGFVEALPRRITMKTFKPTNERCAVIFASPRIGAVQHGLPQQRCLWEAPL